MNEPIAPARLGLGCVLAGGLGIIISDFLPLVASTTFGGVAENSAVQHGGWLYLIAAGLVVMSALKPGLSEKSWPVGLSSIAVLASVYFGLISDGTRTLYTVGPNGEAIAGTEQVAAPGIGAYSMLVSTIILLIGAVTLHQAARNETANTATIPPRPIH